MEPDERLVAEGWIDVRKSRSSGEERRGERRRGGEKGR